MKRDIPVVPVLVQGARVPPADELPDNLKELAFRNAVELTHARWESDVQLLIKALRPFVQVTSAVPGVSPPVPAAARRRATMPVAIGVASAVLLAAAIEYTWYRNSPNQEQGAPLALSTPPVPGTWRGTLTFYAAVTPISIRFDDDYSLDLTSPRGTVASGTWSKGANDVVSVDARHQQLGPFACELKTTNASIKGRCTANGNYAGEIALSDRGPLNP